MNSSLRSLSLFAKISILLLIASIPAMAQSVTGACLYALDTTAQNAFSIAGSTAVSTACSVVVESSASQAFEMEGSETFDLLNHAQVGVVGGSELSGQTELFDTMSDKQVQPVTIKSPGDPLASLTAPTTGTIVGKSHMSYDMNNKPTNNTLSPGVYCDGLTIGNTNGATFTMSPGTYIMAGGGLTINSLGIVVGSGVTVYNTSSAGWGCSSSYSYTPITISGQANVTLSAPLTGTLAGILIFGNRTGCATAGSCTDQINGGSTTNFNGAVYLKSDKLLFSGNNSSTGCMVVVADEVAINGSSSFGSTGCAINPVSVSLTPATATLYGGQTQQFVATVTNTGNTVVTWTISPAGVGTISSSGLYTAPASIAAQETVTVTATSQVDTTKSASATVTLQPKTTPIITWATPAAITYGTALSATQLDATFSVPGTCIYSPAAGTVLNGGTQKLTVACTPTNTVDYNTPATLSVSLTVNPAAQTIGFSGLPAAATYGAAGPYTLSATGGASGNPVTFSLISGPGSVSGNTLTITGAGTVVVAANQAGNTNYAAAAQLTQSIAIGQATPTITWATPAAITYGTALNATQLDASFSVAGACVYTPSAGTILNAGAETLSVTCTPTVPADYSTATATVTLAVTKATPTITWSTPAAIPYGTALSAMQLDATASVPGTFVYSPVTGTVPTAGTQDIAATFTPTDGANYSTVTASVSLVVTKATPTITWAAPAAISYGTALSATQLDASFSVAGTCAYTPAAGMVLSAGAQTLSVTCTPTDSANYNATTAAVSITVNPAAQTIVFSGLPATATYGTSISYTLSATGGASSNPVIFSLISGPGSASGNTLTITGAGTVVVAANQAGNTNYAAAAQVTQSIAIGQATPTITWEIPAAITYGTTLSATQLDATVSVPGTFVYTPAAGTVLTAGTQTLTATFTPTDTADYTKATATVALTVSKTTPTITWVAQAAISYGTALSATQLDASFSVPGTCAYTPDAGTVLSAGTQTLSVTCTPTDSADYNATTASVALAVNKSTPTITWSTPAAISYVTALSATQLDATASVPGTFVYTPAAGTVPTAGTQTLTATFTPTDTTDYSTATASVSLVVTKATPTIAWAAPAEISYGTVLSATQLDASFSVAGTCVYAPTTGIALNAGVQTLSVTCSPSDSTDYNATTATVSITVNPAAQAIIFSGLPATAIYGTSSSYTLSATGGASGNPVTFSLISGPGSVSGNTLTITGAGTVVVAANQAENTNYAAAAQVTQGIAIGQATPTITWETPAAITYGTTLSATQLDATASVAGTFVYMPAAGTVLTAGTQTLTATFTPTDTTDYTTATAAVALTVNKAVLTVTANNASRIYGIVNPSLTASYTGLVNEDTVSVLSGSSSLTTTATTSSSVGTYPITAAAGTLAAANYSFSFTSGTLTISQTTSVITWTAPAAITYGTALSATQLDASFNVPGTCIYTPAAGAVLSVGTQTLSVTCTPTDTVDYGTPAVQAVSLLVNQVQTQCNTNGYSYVRSITIDHTKVPNTDQVNFPFLFNTTDLLLANTANGGHVMNANGDDIIFTSDPAGQNQLPYEMETYNSTTGQVIAWVNIPTVSHTTDTIIYMFYGNSSITTSQQNPTGVWGSNYGGVWHLGGNGILLSTTDSTANANNTTVVGSASETPGEIGYAVALTGSPDYIDAGNNPSVLPTHTGTMSVWVNYNEFTNWTTPMGDGNTAYDTNGTLFWNDLSGDLYFEVDDSNSISQTYTSNLVTGQWYYLTGTWDGSTVSLYENGVLVSSTPQTNDASPTYDLTLGVDGALSGSGDYLNGSLEEARVSGIARSADWIATEYANQSSPATFYGLSAENIMIEPISSTLYAGQTQQFTATVPNACSNSVSWTLNSSDAGTISADGLYSAPATINTPQTVTVTATSSSDPTKSVSATINLLPPVAVSLSPANLIISDGNQTQQFTASVANAANTAVTWSISLTDAGTIDQNGIYTAPAAITAQQTVTVTATSQFDPTKSATTTITLSPAILPPPPCASSGYSFVRAIVINHNFVPNTDQANFPFLFNSTDPAFATTSNGGHMTNEDGYDIIFTSDPAGQHPLNYEIEDYNPVTGQVIAWIGIPNLSHTTDTVLYMFYGNRAIAASQQNPVGVWDANFMGVWHVPNGTQLSLADSTSNGDNATDNGATATSGQIGGGMATDGSTYATIGYPANLTNLAHGSATLSAWVNSSGNVETIPGNGVGVSVNGGIILGKAGFSEGGWTLGLNSQGDPQLIVYDADNGGIFGSSSPVDSGWNYITATISQNASNPVQSQVSLYVNGALSATGAMEIDNPVDDSGSPAYLANNDVGDFDDQVFGSINGSEDEFRISNIARSADWITSQYNNQSSPSTFYQLYSENLVGVVPATTSLYASQLTQFTALEGCGAADISWSMPAGSPGGLSTTGLYTAPASIAAPQTVTVTAASQADGSTVGTSTVTLMPPVAGVSVSPSAVILYGSGETQQFTASVVNGVNQAVMWTVSPVGMGTISATGLYTAPSFYTTETVTITATSNSDPTKSGSVTLTLMPVIVSPEYTDLFGGYSQQFTANIPVNWSIGPGGVGTITAQGLYIAPFNLPYATQVPIIAAAQVDPNAIGYAFAYITPSAVSDISPTTATLIGGQTQQYTVSDYTVSNASSDVSWSVTPTGAGSISVVGLYSAPAYIATKQTATVTATSIAYPLDSISATVTLIPPSIRVTPVAATLYGGQTQQFFATVTDSTDNAFTWSISPSGIGVLSSSGLYTAPPVISSQQIITITATSQAVPSISVSAVVTLSPAQCVASSYGYVRSIVIDHTKVPNLDQINFPFFFSLTDPSLASITNGGHVTSANGNDIVFSTDPAGVHTLDYELEQYNPVTGQIAAWIRVPTLSHTSDTVLYMFYGNPSISAPQQNPSGVWGNNYSAVYQFDGLQGYSLADLTTNGNNASLTSIQEVAGTPGGAASFNGTSSFISLPMNDFSSYPVSGGSASLFNSSFGVWFKTLSSGVILEQTGDVSPGDDMSPGDYDPYGSVPALYVDTNGNLRASMFWLGSTSDQIITQNTYNDNNWHYAVLTFDTDATTNDYGIYGSISSVTSGIETLYVDGQNAGSQVGAIDGSYRASYAYFLGTGYAQSWTATSSNSWFYFNGDLDQVEISNVARSSDWVTTEFLNQSSPSTFFTLSPEATGNGSVTPAAVTLYGYQSQQFTVLASGLCNAGNAAWSMPVGSPGTLSPSGLYTAPATNDTQQTITVTATTLGANSTPLTATITLMPPVAVTVSPAAASLPTGGAQQFTATVTNTGNTAVTWSISPVGTGNISTSGLYTAPATLNSLQTVSVIATSQADPTQSASATIVLGVPAPPPVVVVVSPISATLYGDQTQQFTATVTNTSNTGVTWSISPAGVGSIDATGLYTAPATVSSQQAITITATSLADTTQSASAYITLAPTECTSNGYSYVRTITIDHTQVPNTDQTNFPFLFNTTDPLLATTTNDGHVTNPNGYDIIFSTDPNGLTPLNYEMETYNPATGQVVAWVQIPDLSHTSDTVLYMFYGNPNITASQQNPTGVWDSNYGGVWHLGGNGTTVSTVDSTANANNATVVGTVSATPANFGYGAALPGNDGYNNSGLDYIDAGNNPSVEPVNSGTMSVWVNLTTFSSSLYSDDMAMGNGTLYQFYPEYGALLWTDSASPNFSITMNTAGASDNTVTGSPMVVKRWYYLTGTWNGSVVNLYLNGALVSSETQTMNPTPAYDLKIGSGLDGDVEEARISDIARSSDWIAAEYNNQSSPSNFYVFSSEGELISPATVTLYASQSQQFTALRLCNAVGWSMPADVPGTLAASGLYTAPASIESQQTVTITATSQTNPTNSTTATVTLMPPVSVTVSPASVTLTTNQTQLFTAAVNNSFNQAVTWSVSPAGLGSIDQTGAYIAPSSIATQQTVTITATSQEDPTKYASAMVTLASSVCASTGYGYQRVIVIDHTKVPNTDEINYPFLFNTTDPDLATVDNGGHVTNPNGYDIFFSTDPNGQTRLDFEVEHYDPVTGQLVAWIRIPTLSHTSDTVIYVFYSNPAIVTSQANPTGVWDSNYQAVYHLGNLPSTEITPDSTSNANDASFTYLTPVPGQIGSGASLDGAISYLQIPSTAFPSYPTGVYTNLGEDTTWNNTTFSATYGIWFKTASWGGLLAQTPGNTPCGGLGSCVDVQPGDQTGSGWTQMLDINSDGNLEGLRGYLTSGIVGPTTKTYNDNDWHYAVITFENGVDSLYADGQLVGTGQGGIINYSPTYAYFVGTENIETDSSSLDAQPWQYLNGQIDEINVSSTARSADWIQTQYNNQSSPSTFYKFYSPSAIQVAPAAISLYAGQSEQFVVPATCDTTITWSLAGGSSGTLTPGGLYTAPSVISGQQTAGISATSQSNGSSLGSALVALLPAPQPITLVASTPSPYQVGSSQTFTATALDPQGNPLIGVAVNFMVAGVNETVVTAITGATGTASFTYTGSNSGTDTIEATASVDGTLLTSNSITAAWLTPPPAQAPTITLLPQPSPGRGALVGAFTDINGNVIEPIVVGSSVRTFIVPTGATQLQLGIDDNYYEDNGGSGFVVAVNGANVTVPPTAMPWNWKTGGLNNNYQYGINDGTAPIVAAASLTAGEPVTVAYQSGTVSTDLTIRPLVDANGESGFIAGVQIYQGAYFPTLYTTGTSYPQNQPINVFAVVTDATGTPIPNATVTLNVSGTNPGQFQATTDATGTASFLYTGQYAGDDSLQAQATVSDQGTLDSNQTSIAWTNYPTPPPVGSLSLNFILTIVNQQYYSSFAKDASGNPLPNVNVGFYITGVDAIQSSSNTSDTGQATSHYYHTQSGNYSVIAVDSAGRNVIITKPYTGTWTVPTGTQSGTGSTGSVLSIGITGNSSVTLPNALQLDGTVTDTSGLTPTLTWTQVSGPGTVTFASSNQAASSATFSQDGTYILELSATDALNSGWAQFTVTVLLPSGSSDSQGWIGVPTFGTSVSGIVPITVASGITLASGTLSYYPANNTSNPNLNAVVLNANTTGTGQIGVLDTTQLQNGSYWIWLQATDSSGTSENSLILVTVTGNYKPGRVTTTVTDLVVPSNGLPIQIQRTYDSLNATTVGDFGYGWNLGINTDLTVDPKGDVTFTLGGQRKTFYLTYTEWTVPIGPFGATWYTGYYFPVFTPEPGLHGTLSDAGTGCTGLDILTLDGSLAECDGGGQYIPSEYIYTDPNGTSYTISASGALQSIVDRSGNNLQITANGITSSTGLNVPFVRDSEGRITQITDPEGNVYQYGYDANGNLATVTYPTTSQPSTYTYDANHYYLSGTDFRDNPLPSVDYYSSGDTDAEGNSLSGRMKSMTDAAGNTTGYAYDLSTNTTTITYPPDASGNVGKAIMVYDTNGNLLSSTDPLGHITANKYDANNELTSTTDSLGYTTSYTYDANGNKTSQSYPVTATSTNTTSYTNYNQYSEPTSTIDELGNTRTFNYDANYNPSAVTDTINGQTSTIVSSIYSSTGLLQAVGAGVDISTNPASASTFAYDANGDMVSAVDPLGHTRSFTYDALGRVLTATLPSAAAISASSDVMRSSFMARVGTQAADSQATGSQNAGCAGFAPPEESSESYTVTYVSVWGGPPTEEIDTLGRSTKYTYDSNQNLTSVTDPNGDTYTYTYDSLNRLTQIGLPSKPATYYSFSYDFRNNVVDAIDPSGHDRHNVYDLAGRLTSVTLGFGSANASTTSFAYDADGRVTSVTDAIGHATSYTYDAAGNLLSVQRNNVSVTYAYDNARNRISQTDGNGNTTQFQYDARQRLQQVTFADQTADSFSYNGAGKVIEAIDQAGHSVQSNYDAANHLCSLVQNNNPSTSNNTLNYLYDAVGNLTAWTDQNGHQTTEAFDALNRPVMKTLPDGIRGESSAYDPNSNPISLSRIKNGAATSTASYTYDSLNRLLSETPDPSFNEPTVSFTYTPNGLPATMTDGTGVTTYTYDDLDRLTSKATPEGTLSYTYDAVGNVASMQSSNTNGASVSYTYDDLNRLSTVVDNNLPSGKNTTTYSYDSASNLATATYPNGLQAVFSYDQLNRLSQAVTPNSGYSYQRDANGNLTSDVELSGRTVNWTYDGVDQLTNETVANAASKANGSVSYSLDPVGNRLSDTSTLNSVASAASTYDADDWMASESYDDNGDVVASGGNTYAYDSQSRLVSMNGGQVTLLYDGLGNRAAKTVNGVTTRYLVDDLSPTGYPQVVDELTNGAVTRSYTYGLQRISENQIVNSAWTPSFYQYDGRGTVRMLTNSAGAVTDSYEYDAFGNLLSQTGSTPNNYLYRGEQWDPDLGLYYLRARYYNPVTGRFMTQDPYAGEVHDPATLHRYRYASGNPVNSIDPSGRDDLMEYGKMAISAVNTAASVYALSQAVSCLYGAEASAIQVVNAGESTANVEKWLGFQLDAATCSASAVLAADGLGVAEDGIGFFAAEGEPLEVGPELPGPELSCGLCFAAGTPVHTDHGNVPIERIKAGDKVWAQNEKTGVTELRTVTAVAPQHRDTLVELRIAGESSVLRATPVHPFRVRRGAGGTAHWIDAGDLIRGDEIKTQAGRWAAVQAVTPLKGLATVYNFTVDQDHDYFVGDEGLMVHNAVGCEGLDWSRPRWDGDTTPGHVLGHASDNPSKYIHGVFADDPIATAEEAWQIAMRDGITPTVGPNGNWIYDVPFPEAGLGGGITGNAAGNPILNTVRIVTEPGGNTIVTAFPR